MRIRLGLPLSLGEIANALGIYCPKAKKYQMTEYLSTDTRELEWGDLFFALKGPKFDGENYLSYAKSRGAITVGKSERADLRVISTDEALLKLAVYFKEKLINPSLTVAITGSVGKTTTKEFLKVICAQKYKVHANEGNYNNKLGFSLTLLTASRDTELLITEMGTNSFGEISELSRAAKPNIAIITKIGTAHIGRFGSRKGIAGAKLEILDGMNGGRTVIPYGEPLLESIGNKTTFSISDKKADVFAKMNGKDAVLTIHGKRTLKSSFTPLGEHNLECLCAAVAAALDTGLCTDDIKRGISLISSDNIRQKVYKLGNILIFDDSYNSSYEAVLADFKLLSSLRDHVRKSALIGSILELGDMSEKIHLKLGEISARQGFSTLFFYGEFADALYRGALVGGYDKESIHVNKDVSAPKITAQEIYKKCRSGELLFIKGSHGNMLSRITDELKTMYGE